MAVFPDRIVLKNSTDSDADIRTAIEVGGTDEIYFGEVVLGLDSGNVRLYTRDAADNIVAFGGSNSEDVGGLDDVDLSEGVQDGDILQFVVDKFKPRTLQEAGALTAVADDLTPQLSGNLNINSFALVANSTNDNIFHNYRLNAFSLTARDPVTNNYSAFTYTGTANIDYALPATDGLNGFALVTDGSGNLSWSAGVSADLSLSAWESLSNVTVRDTGSKSIWCVDNADNNTTATFRPLVDDSTSDHGLTVDSTGFAGVSNGNNSGWFYVTPAAESTTTRGAYMRFGTASVRLYDSSYLAYNHAAPARGNVNQFTTFKDLDDLELSLQGEISNIAIDDLTDVDLTTIPPVDGQTLVYSSSAFGGSGGWLSASLPGTGTVTSVGINNTGGLVVANSPIISTGDIDLGLETIATITPGAYPAANVTVDQFGRVTAITSGGNGSGYVTSVNGESGDVSLDIFDLVLVGRTPGSPATGSPEVEGTWTIQCLGGETLLGNGRWKAQVDPNSPATSELSANYQDGDPINHSTEISTVASRFSNGEDMYFQVEVNGFNYDPTLITTFTASGATFTAAFASADLDVSLFNQGDLASDTNNVDNRSITIRLGGEEAFDFGGANPGQGEILSWNNTEGEFRPLLNTLGNSTDVNVATAVAGQGLIYDGSNWTAQDVNTESHVKEYIFSANGSTAFRITGPGMDINEDNPTFYVQRGDTVKLTHNAGGGAHPINITDSDGVDYDDGFTPVPPITSAVGTSTWIVPQDAPAVLKYVCTSHPSMTGEIVVGGGGGTLDLLSDCSYQNGSLEPVDLDQIVFSSVDVPVGVISKVFTSATYGTSMGHLESDDSPGAAVYAHNTRGVALSHAGDLFHLQGDPDLTTNQPELRWHSGNYVTNSGFFVGINIPAGLSASQTYTLPAVDGSAGDVLITDGNGAMSWSTTGGGSALTVLDKSGSGGTPVTTVTSTSIISFDAASGFTVTDLGSGEAFVELSVSSSANAFSPWQVSGQTTLTPTGEEAVEFVAGSGVEITTDDTTTPKQIIFTATGGGGGGAGGALDAGRASETQTSTSSGLATFTDLGHSGTLLDVQSSVDAWITLYTDAAARTADGGRSYSTDPTPGSGIVAEFYVTAGSTVLATPGTNYFNNDTNQTEALYALVRNQAGGLVVSDVTIRAYASKNYTGISGGTFGSG